MKIAVYPGSFNPWHEGHSNILCQASVLFDKVIVVKGINPEKLLSSSFLPDKDSRPTNVEFTSFTGLLSDFVKEVGADVIIKGLRNTQDFEYEKIQQYWNEDLGVIIPTVYIIADRDLVHISSSAIRAVEKFKK